MPGSSRTEKSIGIEVPYPVPTTTPRLPLAPSPGPSPRVENPGAGPLQRPPIVVVAPPPPIAPVPQFSNGTFGRNIDVWPCAAPTSTLPSSSCMEIVTITSIPYGVGAGGAIAKSIACWSVIAMAPPPLLRLTERGSLIAGIGETWKSLVFAALSDTRRLRSHQAGTQRSLARLSVSS